MGVGVLNTNIPAMKGEVDFPTFALICFLVLFAEQWQDFCNSLLLHYVEQKFQLNPLPCEQGTATETTGSAKDKRPH
jgi:hypothetical protein